jgi:hypothetical protein
MTCSQTCIAPTGADNNAAFFSFGAAAHTGKCGNGHPADPKNIVRSCAFFFLFGDGLLLVRSRTNSLPFGQTLYYTIHVMNIRKYFS